MNYTLIKARESDFDFIYDLKKISVKPYVEKIWGWDEEYQMNDFKNDFKNIDDFSLIILSNDTIGFLQLASTESSISIVEIHLNEVSRSKGIGSSIIQEIIDQGINNNRSILLGCFKDNKRAKELYQRIGFNLVGETESHYKFELSN